jgi:hypothetical protein
VHSISDYSKSTSAASIGRVSERWQPFVRRFGYEVPELERSAA